MSIVALQNTICLTYLITKPEITVIGLLEQKKTLKITVYCCLQQVKRLNVAVQEVKVSMKSQITLKLTTLALTEQVLVNFTICLVAILSI